MQLLLFELDDHRYAIDTRHVQEIVRAAWPARLPHAPSVIAGILNVRGQPVPLVDLRLRFGLPPKPLRADEVFVIARTERGALAFRADRAAGLAHVAASEVAPLRPEAPHAAFTAGAVLLPDGVLLLCDAERFVAEAERLALDEALARESEARPA